MGFVLDKTCKIDTNNPTEDDLDVLGEIINEQNRTRLLEALITAVESNDLEPVKDAMCQIETTARGFMTLEKYFKEENNGE